jgi:predicted ribosome quality control (RQC) complex YloA/Tae2 family protein
VHDETIKAVVREIGDTLKGRLHGKVFQLSPFSLAIDFSFRKGRYLLINVDPKRPRVYLINRRAKELEQQSLPLTRFAQSLVATLGGGKLVTVTKDQGDRVVRFSFETSDVTGDKRRHSLIGQLTGRSANLFILDSEGIVTHVLRSVKTLPENAGQREGDSYHPPTAKASKVLDEPVVKLDGFPTISAAADSYYAEIEAKEHFRAEVKATTDRLRKEISQRTRLRKKLERDLAAHGEPNEHKRLGDLLLANLTTAERTGTRVRLKDYYAESEPVIEIEVEEKASLQEEATRYFARYMKAKRAAEQIRVRMAELDRELLRLHEEHANLEKAIASGDEAAVAAMAATPQPTSRRESRGSAREAIPGVRRYRSSDGYEILVGRAARDNDRLTFHLARGNDLWLHAGDYPGSHVIVRNPSRKEIPRRTLVEAAQLAGKFSQASKDAKVVVHYTQRKFLSKPKGAAPGLVRLSSFRSITVEPKEGVERL